MYPTRRGWAVVALVAVLAGIAVVFGRPLVLVGAALVGAWLLAQQYRFLWDLERTVASLSIAQSPARTAVQTGDEVPVTLTAQRGIDTALTLEIVAGVPIAATATERLAVDLEPDTERANQTRTVTWPVAGRHSFAGASVTATDGLFRETITAGTTPTLTVEPPSPRTIHVGEGGDRVAASYGAHEAGRTGSGIEHARLRKYVPGDTGAEIDWKATARHATPYVREYEAEADRRTLLIVDHRASLSTGSQAETKLEGLREVALVIAGNARRLNDPIGLVTVGDNGITDRFDLASPAVNYSSIRRRLLELEPTNAGTTTTTATSPDRTATTPKARAQTAAASTTDSGGTSTAQSASGVRSAAISADGGGISFVRRQTSPEDVRRSLADIEGADDAFAQTLRSFYADQQVYQNHITEDPLYGAVERAITTAQGSLWTVICTDDSRPAELRKTVTLAQRRGNEVTVFLAPSVLYEPGELADVERAYDRYVAFEDFRRELSQMDGVTALEVGPADRLAAVLEAGRSRGGRT